MFNDYVFSNYSRNYKIKTLINNVISNILFKFHVLAFIYSKIRGKKEKNRLFLNFWKLGITYVAAFSSSMELMLVSILSILPYLNNGLFQREAKSTRVHKERQRDDNEYQMRN